MPITAEETRGESPPCCGARSPPSAPACSLPDLLIGGISLIGRLLMAIEATGNADLKLNTAMEKLIVEDGRVVGVEAVHGGKRVRYRADRGVLLAAGGFERNGAMREKFGVPGTVPWSSGAPGGNGRAIEAGVEIGAAVDLMDQGWWTPGLIDPEGNACLRDRRVGRDIRRRRRPSASATSARRSIRPGGDRCGRSAAWCVSHSPFWWLFMTARFEGPPCPIQLVRRADRRSSGRLRRSGVLEEQGGVPWLGIGGPGRDCLRRRWRRPSRASTISRGRVRTESSIAARPLTTGLSAIAGDRPNKALVPIDKPPYYAAALTISDMGTKGGLKTGMKRRVS